MNRIIAQFILLSVFVVTGGKISAQDIFSHAYDNLISAQGDNPAYRFDGNIQLSLGNYRGAYYSDGITLDKLIVADNGVNNVKVKDILEDLNQENYLKGNSELNIVAVGMAWQNFQFSAGYDIVVDGMMTYTKDLAKLIANGNAPYIGESLDLSTGINWQAYQAPYLGLNYGNEKWSIGARLQWLNGVNNLYTEKKDLSIYTNDEIYQLEVNSDLEVYSAGVLDYNGVDSVSITNDIFDNLGLGKNTGLAIDLGLVYQANEAWSFSAALTDIGKIKWSENTKKYYSNEINSFEGVNILDIIDDDQEVILKDSLESLLSLNEKEEKYETKLNSKLQLAAKFAPNDRWEAIASYTRSNNHVRNFDQLSALFSYKLLPILKLTSGATYVSENSVGIPLAAQLDTKLLKAIVATENILSPNIGAGRINSWRIGIFLTFGAE